MPTRTETPQPLRRVLCGVLKGVALMSTRSTGTAKPTRGVVAMVVRLAGFALIEAQMVYHGEVGSWVTQEIGRKPQRHTVYIKFLAVDAFGIFPDGTDLTQVPIACQVFVLVDFELPACQEPTRLILGICDSSTLFITRLAEFSSMLPCRCVVSGDPTTTLRDEP